MFAAVEASSPISEDMQPGSGAARAALENAAVFSTLEGLAQARNQRDAFARACGRPPQDQPCGLAADDRGMPAVDRHFIDKTAFCRRTGLAPGQCRRLRARLLLYQVPHSQRVCVMAGISPPVAIIMGSQSDWATMRHAAETLDALGVAYDARIVSAHRTPERMAAFARNAVDAGFKVIIAGAGGAAHLPGMTAAMTRLPVFGVPVESKALSGQDSLLSIVQMPAGIPVGTLAIGRAGAVNAALLATAVLALRDAALAGRLDAWRAQQTASVAERPVDEAP